MAVDRHREFEERIARSHHDLNPRQGTGGRVCRREGDDAREGVSSRRPECERGVLDIRDNDPGRKPGSARHFQVAERGRSRLQPTYWPVESVSPGPELPVALSPRRDDLHRRRAGPRQVNLVSLSPELAEAVVQFRQRPALDIDVERVPGKWVGRRGVIPRVRIVLWNDRVYLAHRVPPPCGEPCSD